MSREKFLMNGSACTWRYLRILLLSQRPISLKVPLSTTEQRRAMEPSARTEQAYIYLASNPRFGPQKPAAVLRFFEIMVRFIFSTYPPDS